MKTGASPRITLAVRAGTRGGRRPGPRVACWVGPIESRNGARFVHDQLELRGWAVEIADAVKVTGFAPLACKTDKIDAWVLAELSRRELVPAIWLPTPGIRAERERARWRLHPGAGVAICGRLGGLWTLRSATEPGGATALYWRIAFSGFPPVAHWRL